MRSLNKSSSIVAVLWCAFFLECGYADLPSDPRDYAEWQGKMLQAVTDNHAKGDHEAIEKLARYVLQLSLPTNLEQGDRPVFRAAKGAILSLPNHGEFFSQALERAIDAEFAEARDAASAVRVDPSRDVIYLTLAELPSPQVVGLLGDLLYDDRDPWKDEPKSDYVRPFRNSAYAVDTLNRIGLEGVQIIEVKTTRDREAALGQWKLWYEQVKAGTRTFRFKGDPNEYSLAGPVVKAAEPVVRRPESKGANTSSQEAIGKPSKLPVSALVGAIALLIAAIGVAMKKRSSAAAAGG
ncbi:MAG TPA: hypothetical protein VGE67_01850 [Haloferula sp.]